MAYLRWLCCLVFCLPSLLYPQDAISDFEIETQVCYARKHKMTFLQNKEVYAEGWSQLPQVRFWQKIMTTNPEKSYVNIAYNRWLVDSIPTEYFDSLEREDQRNFKKSKLFDLGLPDNTRLYVTSGKNDYYQHELVLNSISEAIPVFLEKGVNPWFAQAILLIESPGKLRTSYVGAHGPFQLMRSVAIGEGLTVTRELDEREDLPKAAGAAATYIKRVCQKETRRMLNELKIPYNEDDLWFRLLVLHVYHAGAGNVYGALRSINPESGGIELITQLWHAEYRGFKNSSQNYSQVALAALVQLDNILKRKCWRALPKVTPIEPDPVNLSSYTQEIRLPEQSTPYYHSPAEGW